MRGGVFLKLARFAVLALCLAPAMARAADALSLTPRVFPVGRWAEGLVVTSGAIWVAESGQRTIAELDPDSGAVKRRVKVGRLPVGMVLAPPQGGVSTLLATLVQTDKRIWLQSATGGEGRALSGLEGCPEGLASGGGSLWVLTLPACSSLSSRVIRVDPVTGASAASPILTEWGLALAVEGESVWVANGKPPALSIVDAKTLAARTVDVADASLWTIAAANGRIFVGGRHGGDNDKGLVASIDPASGEVRRLQDVDQRIAFLAVDDRSVVAVGEKGRIWVFAPGTLDLLRVITLTTGDFQPRAAAIHDDRLYVTDQQHDGENGAVLVLTDWRP
jgi:outer membrane protein assembly factor BamB